MARIDFGKAGRMRWVTVAVAIGFSALVATGAETAYVYAQVADGCQGMGKVTGGNKFVKIGSKTTVKATASKGNGFICWENDGEWVSSAASYSPNVFGTMFLAARFVPAEDDRLDVDASDLTCELGYELAQAPVFSVKSVSAVNVTVSGLPSGVKSAVVESDGEWGVELSGTPKKAGIWWVTCSAKNGNGYQSSAVAKVTVGHPAETDYDNIGLGGALERLENLSTGDSSVSIPLDGYYPEDEDFEWYVFTIKSVSGLPTGLKFHKGGSCTIPYIDGRPTKAGKFKVSLTDIRGLKAVKTVIVRDSGSACLTVKAAPESGYMGTGNATGSGVYKIGSKVRIAAKPSKGSYFAGWYRDETCEELFLLTGNAGYKTASGTLDFSCVSDLDEGERPISEVYAKFVTKEEDAYPSIYCSDEWVVESEYWWDYFEVFYESETAAKLTFKGLPSGIKAEVGEEDCYGLYMSDKNKLKPGVYPVTITLKNQSGATAQKTVLVRIPNLRDEIFSGLEYDADYVVERGVSDACLWGWCTFAVESGWKVTASGLPAGLKFGLDADYGESYGRIYGTPTKVGNYTVTLTAKRGSETRKATVSFVVKELPSYVVGTFNGVLIDQYDYEENPATAGCVGRFSLTATAAGKLSVKLALNDGTSRSYSANGWGCVMEDGVYSAQFEKRNRSGCTEYERVYFEVRPGDAISDYTLTGEFMVDGCRVGGSGVIRAQRSPFGKIGKEYEFPEAHELVSTLHSYGKMPAYVFRTFFDEYGYSGMLDDEVIGYPGFFLSCPNCTKPQPGSPEMKFTVSQDGTVKAAGKLGSYTISASSFLRLEYNGDLMQFEPVADFCVYVRNTPIWIHMSFYVEGGANGAVQGQAREGWW